MELAVVGREEFCLGFMLTGMKKVFPTAALVETANRIKSDPSIGVVVVDKMLFDKLDEFQKQSLEGSSKPVFIALSKEKSDDDLKRMIKKSIGVDL